MTKIYSTCIALIVILTLLSDVSSAQNVVRNVNGYTPTSDGIRSFTVLVIDHDGRVLETGDETLLRNYPDAVVVDAGGRTVLPGLIDSHAHVYSFGLLQSNLNLAGSQSVEDSVARIDAFAKANPRSKWITGRGWNQVLWPVKEFPTASNIDTVMDDRPVWLRRIDGHAGWANTVALKAANIDDDTPDPVGGKILRDANGHATGVLIDNAMDIIDAQVPTPGKDEIRDALLAAIDALIAEGLTSVHDAGIDLRNVEVYLSMADSQELKMRIVAMLAGATEVLDAVDHPIRAYGNDYLDVAAVKLVSDGALGSRGAAMIEPYSDDAENRGLPFWTQEQLNAFVEKSSSKGFQVAIHAIGDLGNRMALDAFAETQGGEPSPHRNRIEHAQIITLEDIPRFAQLGVIAAMQTTHATSDKNMAEDRVGPERILGGYAWRKLLDSGAKIANGSDFPIELANPFHGLYAAVTRQDRNSEPRDGWYADQALTRSEALHSYTLAAAYAAHQEDRLGSLEPGKWADFIIIDRDYFTIPASEIDDIRVLETWVGGKRVFAASSELSDDR